MKRQQSKPANQVQPGHLRRLSSDRSALRFVRALHRGELAYVTFHCKRDEFKNLFSVLSKRIGEFSDRVLDIGSDAYFSINGFWRPELEDKRPPRFVKDCAFRKAKHVRYLNAVYSDIDCYKSLDKSLNPDDALKEIGKLIETNQLPPPSCGLIGRGLWLFWLLRDECDPSIPPRARPKTKSVYREVMRKIREVLAPFGSDRGAISTAQLTRIPGSTNSKNGKTVQVLWPQRGNKLPYYTVKTLRRFFKVETSPATPAPKPATPFVALSRKAGNINPLMRTNLQRCRQFLKLEELRGGFKDGCRNHAALICARLLTDFQRVAPEFPLDVAQEVARLGKRCEPPLSDSEIEGALRSATTILSRSAGNSRRTSGRASITNETIREWLEISSEEHTALKKKLGRHAWKPWPDQPRRVDIRRAAIVDLVGENPPPSLGKMADMLHNQGIEASRSQVVKDYKKLGIHTERQKRNDS